jgi:hypothetical protein
MKITKKSLVGLLVSLILFGSMLAIVAGQDPKIESPQNIAEPFSKRSIEGVWLIVAQRRDCQTGDPIGPVGRGLMTFATGGTMSEMTAPPAGPTPLPAPIVRSAGHGVWNRLNWENYTGAFIIQRLNPDGTFVGWVRSRGNFLLMESGNDLTSTGSTEVLDAAGNVLSTGCSTSIGTRFE